MPSIHNMVGDIMLRINPKPSDDNPIQADQVRHWLGTVSGGIVSDWIRKRNGGAVPAQLIKPYDCLLVEQDTDTCLSGCCTRQYFALPTNSDGEPLDILDLPGDAGIVQVLQGQKSIVRLPGIAELQSYRKLEFADKFAYFARMGDRVYLFGGVFPSYCRLTAYIASCDISGMGDGENFPAPDEVIPLILAEAEKIGRAQIAQPKDLQDDGI